MFIQIDNQSRVPVYEQIVVQIEKQVLLGLISAGDQIPSVRSMSMQMHLNPNTVPRAYTELDRKSLIYTISGVGSFISEDALDVLKNEKRKLIPVLEDRIKELALAGITKKEVLDIVDKIYEKGDFK